MEEAQQAQVRKPSSRLSRTLTRLVVWKITPLFASWITSPSNVLFKHSILHSDATVLELGCGISGIIGLALGQRVKSYVLTDQQYVMKLLSENLIENHQLAPSSSAKGRKSTAKTKRAAPTSNSSQKVSNVTAKVLDWEVDEVTSSLVGVEGMSSFDVVIACDCIYNDALIDPLVQTCEDACRLRSPSEGERPTVCVVAQQLRSAEVFESWLQAFHKVFHVYRLPDETLLDGLKSDSGFVIHIGILR